jgi:hypothetical protein
MYFCEKKIFIACMYDISMTKIKNKKFHAQLIFFLLVEWSLLHRIIVEFNVHFFQLNSFICIDL